MQITERIAKPFSQSISGMWSRDSPIPGARIFDVIGRKVGGSSGSAGLRGARLGQTFADAPFDEFSSDRKRDPKGEEPDRIQRSNPLRRSERAEAGDLDQLVHEQ